jgi:dihydrofolate reductase
MQAPGRADEDTRGGFQHGGWATRYADSVTAGFASQNMAGTGGLLLGRRTYEDFFSFWPKQTDNPFTDVLNRRRKYVASNTLAEPLEWSNSTLLKGDAAEAVRTLRDEPDGDLVVLGSGQLVRSLIAHDLVDQFIVLIHPLILGSGKRLFADGGKLAELELRDVKPTTTGVLIATYEPARG